MAGDGKKLSRSGCLMGAAAALSIIGMVVVGGWWYVVSNVPSMMNDRQLAAAYERQLVTGSADEMPLVLTGFFGRQSMYRTFRWRVKERAESLLSEAFDWNNDFLAWHCIFEVVQHRAVRLDELELTLDLAMNRSSGWLLRYPRYLETSDPERLDQILLRNVRSEDAELRRAAWRGITDRVLASAAKRVLRDEIEREIEALLDREAAAALRTGSATLSDYQTWASRAEHVLRQLREVE